MCLTPPVRTGELFDLLRDGRPWTRAQLAEATGLARSTITARIDTLMRLGLVAPFGGARSTGGRPPALFALNPTAKLVVGVDIGATHPSAPLTHLNGSILGLDRASIARRFDEIVAFAEVERFIDTPVKRYSSGMYLRLAFAVAAHLEPEILLVDEVLAVGDAAFQRKCLGRMGHAALEGRTVLFVSHNMTAVQGLCARAIWLDKGGLREVGSPGAVVSRYLQDAAATCPQQSWPDAETAPGNDRVRLRAARARPADGDPEAPITTHSPVLLEFEYWNLREGARLSLTLHLTNEDGVLVLAAGPVAGRQWQPRPLPRGLFRDTCLIPGDLLNDGLHRVEILVVDRDVDLVYRHMDVLVFEVRDTPDLRGSWFGKWKGAVRPILDWTTEPLEDPAAAAPSTTA